MKAIDKTLLFTLITLFMLYGCANNPQTTKENTITKTAPQDVQVFTSKNSEITPKSIEDAFVAIGLDVLGNNDMNKPFKARFGSVNYPVYNLAMYVNNDLTYKLIKKYPSFGALTPLTMSIWKEGDTTNIATLTLNGMARAAQIPLSDPDLTEYAALIKKALHQAMPNGEFKKLSFTPSDYSNSLQINFVSNIDLDKDVAIEDYIEDFEAEFEGELEPLGFLFPNYSNLQEELFDDHDYHEYDFYHTYSICKFDVIYPVSKLHPEAGAWAPCSFYIYKKKDEDKMHMGFLSVENWISSLDIADEDSIKPLRQAQEMIKKVVNEMSDSH